MFVVAIWACATASSPPLRPVQTDISASSPIPLSQLGYMFLACGVGAFSAGIFHLMTMPSSKRYSSSLPAASFTPWAASKT